MIIPLADNDMIVQAVNEPDMLLGWYFVDEDGCYHGPWITDQDAINFYNDYCDAARYAQGEYQ